MKRMIVIASVAVVFASMTASHAGVQLIVAPPGAQVAGVFDGPDAAVKGQQLTFVNLDAASSKHNVMSVKTGPDSSPWCSANHFSTGRCPLFFSDLVAAGGTSTVDLRNVAVGQTYDFVCMFHPNMKGTLQIVN
jgi:plastocyanin